MNAAPELVGGPGSMLQVGLQAPAEGLVGLHQRRLSTGGQACLQAGQQGGGEPGPAVPLVLSVRLLTPPAAMSE